MNPSSLTFETAYWNDDDRRAAFKRFMIDIHGLDFSLWEGRGFWDDAYRPFSFFDGSRIVSSVCLYSMDFVVEGKEQKVAQISGVGTDPAWRRKGLNRELTNRATAWARENGHQLFFLFADEDAVGFYRRMGFCPSREYVAVTPVNCVSNRDRLRKLDICQSEDFKLVERLAQGRCPVSKQLGNISFELTMFHVLYTLSDKLFYCEELDVVLCLEFEGDKLRLYDVIGVSIPSFQELLLQIGRPMIKRAEFMFTPDLLSLSEVSYLAIDSNNLHLSAGSEIPPNAMLPWCAHA